MLEVQWGQGVQWVQKVLFSPEPRWLKVQTVHARDLNPEPFEQDLLNLLNLLNKTS